MYALVDNVYTEGLERVIKRRIPDPGPATQITPPDKDWKFKTAHA